MAKRKKSKRDKSKTTTVKNIKPPKMPRMPDARRNTASLPYTTVLSRVNGATVTVLTPLK